MRLLLALLHLILFESKTINLSQKSFYIHSINSSSKAINQDTLKLFNAPVDSVDYIPAHIWFYDNGKFEATFDLKTQKESKALLKAVTTSNKIIGKWKQKNDSLFINSIADTFDSTKIFKPLNYTISTFEEGIILTKVKQ
tara:strand:+ start:511 stop:930 length:420 start_codon:yes stop_codon:yes gene_type:complete